MSDFRPPEPDRTPGARADQPYEAMADEALLSAFVAGDREAFAEIVHRHGRVLRAVARRLLRDRSEVDDVVQSALLSAMRMAASFRGRSSVRTWLVRIAVHAAIDVGRRRAARPIVALSMQDERAEVVAPALPDVAPEGVARVVVAEMLARLPEPYRRVLVLVDLLGFSLAEAATVLEVAEGTVKSRRHRAFAALADFAARHR